MNEPVITCPSCKTEIKLTESLAAPLVESTRRQFEERLAQSAREMQRREAELLKEKDSLARERDTIAEKVAAGVKAERERIVADEARKAKLALQAELDGRAREVADLNAVLKQREEKLAEAQKAQAALLRKERELDDAKRELELTVEKRVQETAGTIRDKARRDAEDELKLKVTEKEQTIATMQRQIEELRRKADQGSQQLQGEALEVDLENLLRAKFPMDLIEPVPVGEFGGDVLHRVVGPGGMKCGTILWEMKRAKNWSEGWLAKLRDDQRAAKAEMALIISSVLPKGVETFDRIEGVWVAGPRCAIPVAIALRQSLIELATARQAGEGQQTKMELVYQYLTGPRFRQRVEAIVEKFSDMQEDLDRERRQMSRLWAKREEQIRGVIDATAGMYGDLQGIAGRTLQEIDGLTLPALEDDAPRLL